VSRLGGWRLAPPVLVERLAVVARKPDRLDRGGAASEPLSGGVLSTKHTL